MTTKRYPNGPQGRRARWTKAATVEELIERVRPFVRYIEDCFGMDPVAAELECALDGDPEDAETDSFGDPLLCPTPVTWLPPRTWGYDDCLPLGTPGVWAKDRLGWCIREARPPELVCLTTPERTTAGGLVLPESCWSDECRPPRSPWAACIDDGMGRPRLWPPVGYEAAACRGAYEVKC